MKIQNIVVSIVLVVVVASLFGWRYWYVPNYVMPKQIAATQLPKSNNVKPKENVKTSEPVKTVKKQSLPDNPKTVQKTVKTTEVTATKNQTTKFRNLLKNSTFKSGKDNWQPWQHAKNQPDNLKIISVDNNNDFDSALKIENPNAVLIGMQQVASVKSGSVYRLSGTVRSMLPRDDDKIFGGRISVYLPPQKEKQIVWMGEYNKWWKKELVFTNQVSGIAVIYVHLGYGGVSSTGEFTNIKLEEVSY